MQQRIALTIQLHPDAAHWRSEPAGAVHLVNADTDQPIVLPHQTFLLTLNREPESSYVRGQLRALDGDGDTYPIQSNVALYETLCRWLALAEGGGP